MSYQETRKANIEELNSGYGMLDAGYHHHRHLFTKLIDDFMTQSRLDRVWHAMGRS